MSPFLVPDDFRAFMRAVVGVLDAPGGPPFVDAEDALQDECGYGGRVEGTRYRFQYLTPDGAQRWTMVLDEVEIRAIADGLQIEADGECAEVARTPERPPRGEPLVVWGAYNDDALRVASLDDLVLALDILHRHAAGAPCVLRMWSPSDDQLVAVVWGDACALYVIESVDGYATSTGDAARSDAFEVLDHDGKALVVPWADCVAWPVARRALLRFAAHGDLGAEIPVEGRIPSQLLVHGELDRDAVLASRAEPAREPLRSSLARLAQPAPETPAASADPAARSDAGTASSHAVPHPIVAEPTTPVMRETPSVADLAAWGRRLIQTLFAQGLVELGAGPGIDEISYQLSGLLQAHGEEAESSLDTAEWLANEINSIRGISKLFATPGDVQIALRRTRTAE